MDSFLNESMAHLDNIIYDETFNISTLYVESVEDIYIHGYYTEKTKNKMSVKIKQFFARIIVGIQSFIKEIQMKIDSVVREKQIKKRMKEFKELLAIEQLKGKNNIKMMDVFSYEKKFLKMNDSLREYIDRSSKMDYRSIEQFDRDLQKFDEIVKKYESELNNIESNKIEISIEEASKFVEDNINGNSKVIHTLNDAITEFQKMQQVILTMETKRIVMGEDMIPKRISYIQRLIIKFLTFIKNKVVKFIMTVVFIFA